MSDQIAVFSILDSPALGGAETHLLENLKFLQKKGFAIHLATHNSKIKKAYQQKFNLYRLPYRLDVIGDAKGFIKFFIQTPLAIFWLLKLLTQLKKKHSQVVVYTPGFTERLVFSPFIKLLGVKLIWIEFGPPGANFNKHWSFPKFLYFLVKNYPDKIITISKNSQKSLCKTAKIPLEVISLIYPGTKKISAAQLKKYKHLGQEWRNKNNLKSKQLLTFVGRLAKEKELEIILKALTKINPKQKKSLHLVVVGAGPEKKHYQKLVKKLDLDSQVTFVGYAPTQLKNTILATSEVFIFPSAWALEGFGMTTIEAMMFQTAVISSGAGPQAEIIQNRKNGLIFTPKNPTSLAKKITVLLDNSALRKKLAQAGRETALKKFTLKRMQEDTLKIIQQV